MFEDIIDFVVVFVVYLEVGIVVGIVVLGFDLVFDFNFVVWVVVGNFVIVDYFEVIVVDFVLVWFV